MRARNIAACLAAGCRRTIGLILLSEGCRFPWPTPHSPTGVLLAAGYGSRFDPDGLLSTTLLARMPDGGIVAHEAAHRLLLVVSRVLAVVRPGSDALAGACSNEAGCDVVFSTDAERGMGASLAAGIEASADSEGWIVALADMPRIAVATVEAVARTARRRRIDRGAVLSGPTGTPGWLRP